MLRAKIRDAILHGPTLRKAVLQELVVEVRIESRRLIHPTFRLPLRGVRELSQMVRLEGIEPPALRSGALHVAVRMDPNGVAGCRSDSAVGRSRPCRAAPSGASQGIRDPVVIPLRPTNVRRSRRRRF
jgi:hypothetical protein